LELVSFAHVKQLMEIKGPVKMVLSSEARS